MQATNRTTVVGVFDNRSDAERAADEPRRAGFRDDQIGFIWRGKEGDADWATASRRGEGNQAGEGAATGAIVGGLLGAAGVVHVPVTEEKLVARKMEREASEVEIRKEVIQETKTIEVPVTREEVHVERAATQTGWPAEMPKWRSEWQQRYAATGGRWEQYEPAYRFAREYGSHPEYRGRAFTEIEPNLRRDWEHTRDILPSMLPSPRRRAGYP